MRNHIKINPAIHNNIHNAAPKGVKVFFLYEEYILGSTNTNTPIVTTICITILLYFYLNKEFSINLITILKPFVNP